MSFLFSLACWAATVGALAGWAVALVTGDGPTAWVMACTAFGLAAAATVTDVARKVARR